MAGTNARISRIGSMHFTITPDFTLIPSDISTSLLTVAKTSETYIMIRKERRKRLKFKSEKNAIIYHYLELTKYLQFPSLMVLGTAQRL